ncbi:MAG: methenyltetrahydromethanopterin cyclohydrolase, partial [Planctomycetales bacterium]|nr:methenyltetrahydromethanopterin cyclohydrolase [Planctomycetales bacterium]
MIDLNELAAELCENLIEDADVLRVAVSQLACGATIIDCGVAALGGLEAGRMMAEIALAGLAEVSFLPANSEVWRGPSVQISTDHPVAACMASQYAGWEVTGEEFFAMGSGPMRAAAGREELFQRIGHTEQASVAVGLLESAQLPPEAVALQIAEKCQIKPANLLLLVAPTKSLAGTVQVVARSVETALHKLDDLGFDLSCVDSALGWAPLPPPAKNDLAAIGRTNDAILYGAEVTLYLRGDDAVLQKLG